MTSTISNSSGDKPVRAMFLYLGRRGAMPQFALELGRAAMADPEIEPTITISSANENYAAFKEFKRALMPVDTFHTHIGSVLQAWRIPILRQQIQKRIQEDKIDIVIELMPHVWSYLIAPAIHAAGAKYAIIIHDADAHPGDRTSLVKGLLDRSMQSADSLLTLSQSVSDKLVDTAKSPASKIHTLFHPDLQYCPVLKRRPPSPDEPFRLLFLGRIMPYKGLGLFLDTIDVLKARGRAVEVGVFGEGALGENAERLEAMGAKVINRWLSVEEFGDVLQPFHALVLSHIEASQSGVAAAAFGAGLPVVATPVGGLVEQIIDGKNGVLARSTSATDLADAIEKLLLDPDGYRQICQTISEQAERRSMANFVRRCVFVALAG